MTNATRLVLVLALTLLGGVTGCKTRPGKAFAELAYPAPTAGVKTVKVGTAEVAYVERGQGKHTVLLVHGLGSYLPVWKNNFDALAKDHRVVAIDLPGYGKSSKGNYDYSMSFFAKVVHGVVRELKLGRPIIVGHSMGGQIALTYALRYPGEVEALVLTSPAGLETFEDGEAHWLAQTLTPEFTCKAGKEAIYVRHVQNFYRMPRDAHFMITDREAVVGGPDFPQYCRAVSRSVAGMLDEPVYRDLPKIEVPVLVLFGKQDQLIPNPFLHGGSTVKVATKGVERLPRAQLVILDKAGHMAQFEQSEEWNREVLGFLARDFAPPPANPRAPTASPVTGIQPLYAPGTDPDDADAALVEAEEKATEEAPVDLEEGVQPEPGAAETVPAEELEELTPEPTPEEQP